MPPTLAATNIPPTIDLPAVTASPTPSGWLVTDWFNFLLRGEGYENYLLRPGQSSQFIATGRLVYGQPWSPDGTKFIFDSATSFQANPSPELVIADLATGQTSAIHLLQKPTNIFWSPDGRYLLYLATEGQVEATIQIVLYDFVTQENKVIAEIANEGVNRLFYLVGWSPDGRKIAYVSPVNGQIDLFVLEIESLAVRQLTNTPDIETIALWSTTEDRLLFGTKESDEHALETWPYGARTLYLIDGSGANLMRLSDSFYYSAAWSPSGEKIAYSDGGQICILDIETLSELCPLEDTPPYNSYHAAIGDVPAWSADENWLAFQATGHEASQCYRVYILQLRTKTVTAVDRSTCGVDPFYWSHAVP